MRSKYLKYLYIVVGIVVVVAMVAIILTNQRSCDVKSGDGENTQSQTTRTEAKIDIINREIKNGALLVDVREADEFATGHAQGAINFPLSKIQAGQYPSGDKMAKIYLYCRSGKRASTAATLLKEAGYADVTSLGGLSDWQQIGGSVVFEGNYTLAGKSVYKRPSLALFQSA
jgi:phage shock protein E